MWRLIVLVAVGCAATPHERRRVRPVDVPELGPMRLAFAPTTAGLAVGTEAELEDALASQRKPTAALTEVVEVRWGAHVLDRAAMQAVFNAYRDWPARNALRERHGVADYDVLLRVVLHGYAAQLAQRFGIEPREVWGAVDKDVMRVGVRGAFGRRVVDWNAGVFSISGTASSPPRPARVPKTVETLIVSDRGDYYHVKDLGLAYFRVEDAPANGDRVHRGAVLRTYDEGVEFVDANGGRYRADVEVTRPTPYVIARPGGLPRSGLMKSVHLVRLDLDDSALGGSAPIIDAVTVLDGTPVFPTDLEAAHRAVWQRYYEPDVRAAELALVADEKATLAEFDKRTKVWASQLQPTTNRVESSERRYTQGNPMYTWEPSAKTLTVTFSHQTHVAHTKTVRYPNPALKDFYCQPGAPCATPQAELAHVLELEYVIGFTASYRIDGDGRITRAPAAPPRLWVAR